MFGIILIAPIIQLIFLGYAATLDLNIVHTIFYDQDKTTTSRNFIEEFISSGFFQIDHYADNYEDVKTYIERGKSLVAIVIPKDFEKKINRREITQLQAIFNSSDGNSASMAAGYITTIVTTFSRQIVKDFIDRSGRKITSAGSISAKIRVWYNPELKTRNFMVPAIVGLLVSIVTLILTSLAVVKEKEIGTLEQLIVTPIKPLQLIIGKLVPFVVLGFVSVTIVIVAMNIIFSIHVRGSVVFLFFSSFLYILSTLGLGLFVSTVSKTQQQAMMIAIFAVMMPMIYLSGFAFPVENMPRIIQYISYIIPLKYFITIIRGIILKGNGFAQHWFDATMLLAMGILILFFSALRFRKRLE
ncbi:MAG: ABC transporter permease [Ignavibacteriales bacterium]|nr:ABC transporter permease [Ignavibacteriales bacterium]